MYVSSLVERQTLWIVEESILVLQSIPFVWKSFMFFLFGSTADVTDRKKKRNYNTIFVKNYTYGAINKWNHTNFMIFSELPSFTLVTGGHLVTKNYTYGAINKLNDRNFMIFRALSSSTLVTGGYLVTFVRRYIL